MILNNKPVVRDFTPNSSHEIVKRLRTALSPVTFLVGLALAIGGLNENDDRMLIGAYVCGALFVALLLIPKRWRTPPSQAAVQAANASTQADFTTSAHATITTATSTAAPFTSAASATTGSRPRVLLLNASLAGAEGNSARLFAALETQLAPHADLRRAVLAGPRGETFATLEPALRAADAFVIATGTHWDSWSSPLQKFLEDATPAEATALWLGKPVAVLVTENSTGGKGVLSRLQGVLVTLGCSIPPLSGLVLSQAAQDARASVASSASPSAADYWSPEDLAVVAHNLLAAARQPRADYRAWPVDRTDYHRVWIDTAK